MDYNEDEDNIANTKRSSKSSLPSEQTTFNPSSEAYYSDNRVLIPESDSVSLLLLLNFQCFEQRKLNFFLIL